MKSIYLAVSAALILVACSPENLGATRRVPNTKEIAVGSKKFDLDCVIEQDPQAASAASNLILHIDLERMTYSTGKSRDLFPISELSEHTLFLNNEPGEHFTINRGTGELISVSRTLDSTMVGVCTRKPYTDLGQVF